MGIGGNGLSTLAGTREPAPPAVVFEDLPTVVELAVVVAPWLWELPVLVLDVVLDATPVLAGSGERELCGTRSQTAAIATTTTATTPAMTIDFFDMCFPSAV